MKRLMASLALLLMLTSASAQSSGYLFGGTVMQQAVISPEQMAQLSQTMPLGTSRSMAMAGAFTSLGGDAASMVINPAGLGMFRHNEFTLTPMITVSHSENSQVAYRGNSMTRFTPTNFSLVLNTYEGTGNVVSVNFGLAYNRIADLNYRTSYCYDSPYRNQQASPSILNVMAGQLTVNQVYPDSSGFLGYYGNNYPDLWGAMLAYNNYLINPYTDAAGDFWEADHVGHNALVGHFYEGKSRGSVGEWDLSFGMNINNIVYIGATLGIQQISQRVDTYYGEDYIYQNVYGDPIPAVNADGYELIEQADFIHYNQWTSLSGFGINAKVGVIVRPIPSLRIGAALHTPNAYQINHSYGSSMSSVSYNNDEERYYSDNLDTNGNWDDVGEDSWRFRSPLRLLLGASYAFGSRGVISVDYERAWYNGMRTTNTPWWTPDPSLYLRSAFQRHFTATNTLRVGAEFKPIPRLALRAGLGYSSSLINDPGYNESQPLADKVTWYTGGAGFAITPAISLDVAYQFHRSESQPYRLFYGAYLNEDGTLQLFDAADRVTTQQIRHHIALTMSFRF